MPKPQEAPLEGEGTAPEPPELEIGNSLGIGIWALGIAASILGRRPGRTSTRHPIRVTQGNGISLTPLPCHGTSLSLTENQPLGTPMKLLLIKGRESRRR
jgi:hypothetical protein